METGIFVFLLMQIKCLNRLLLIALAGFVLANSAYAQEETPESAQQDQSEKKEAPLDENELLSPKVKRNEIVVGKVDTEDFEIGVYGGYYSIEDFGSNIVVGARAIYHISELLYVEGTYGMTKGGRTSFERVYGVDIWTDDERDLTYYNVLFGFNLFPGEAFIGKSWAFVNSFYFVAGAGNTNFLGEDLFTINGGFGYSFYATDWLAFRFDFRDHVYEIEAFDEKKTTHNLELTGGFSIFF